MAEESFSLTWHSYANHCQEIIGNLLSTGVASDVTLVCDDQVKFKAHKFVLSACSSVFKSILDEMNDSKAIVYLKGIKHMELKPILDFIYCGQASFYQERTKEFIKVAKELDVKEIKDVPEEEDYTDQDFKNTANLQNQDMVDPDNAEDDDYIFVNDEQESISREISPQGWQSDSEILKLQCPKCDKQCTNQYTMRKHIMVKHEGVKYPCDQCHVQVTSRSHLIRHVKSAHGETRYPCPQCNFKTTRADTLRTHIYNIHDSPFKLSQRKEERRYRGIKQKLVTKPYQP